VKYTAYTVRGSVGPRKNCGNEIHSLDEVVNLP